MPTKYEQAQHDDPTRFACNRPRGNTNTFTNDFRGLAFGCCLWAVVAIVILLTSCSTTKTVTVTRTTTDSTVLHQRDSLALRLQRSTATYERQLEELRTTGVTFQPDCDTVIIDDRCNIDSALKVINALRRTVRINADGSLEATGKIAAAYANSSRMAHELAQRDSIITELSIVNDSLAASKQVVAYVKDKDVKRGFPWLWFFIGMGIGAGVMVLINKYAR